MDGTPRLRRTPELREKWRRRADAAFERMYGGKSQEQLVTMTEREDMAVLIAKELAAILLEEHIALDPAVRPDEAVPPCCPKCGKPGIFIRSDTNISATSPPQEFIPRPPKPWLAIPP